MMAKNHLQISSHGGVELVEVLDISLKIQLRPWIDLGVVQEEKIARLAMRIGKGWMGKVSLILCVT